MSEGKGFEEREAIVQKEQITIDREMYDHADKEKHTETEETRVIAKTLEAQVDAETVEAQVGAETVEAQVDGETVEAQVGEEYDPDAPIPVFDSLEEANAETEKAQVGDEYKPNSPTNDYDGSENDRVGAETVEAQVDEKTLEAQVDEETMQSNALIKEMFKEVEGDKPLSMINKEYRNIYLKFLGLLESVSNSIREGDRDTRISLYDTFKNRAKAYVCFQQYVVDALSKCKLPKQEVVDRLTETFYKLGAHQYAKQIDERYGK